MGLFDRFRTTVTSGSDSAKPDTSEQDATRLIDEGHALEAQGNLDEAMQRYLEALQLAPNPARAHLNRGNILLLQGDLQGALDAFKTAIKHRPDYAGAYYNIGNALQGNRQFDEAAVNYHRALEIQPDYAEVHCSLGIAHKELGQLDDAIASFQHALTINPDLVEAHYSLGQILQGLGSFDDAVTSCRHALAVNPDWAEAHYIMGLALQGLGLLDDAVASYRRALVINPEYAESYCGLCFAQQGLGLIDIAVTSGQRAIEIKPDLFEAHYNLAIALQKLGRFDDAEASYRQSLEIKPDFAEAQTNLGIVLKELGKFNAAETAHRRAIELKPELANAHINLGLLLLTQGRFAEGWLEHEARYDPSYSERQSLAPELGYPRWQGESLSGKSLLIWPEQGLGDEIQFSRYIPLLKSRGVSRVTLVCKQPLKSLLGTLEGVDAVVTLKETGSLPLHDYWAFPMSLPRFFDTTVETIPAVLPYLAASSEQVERWRRRLPAQKPKVGLVWKGNASHTNDANRSLSGLSMLAPLWSVPGVIFISLQKGQGEEDAAMPLPGQPILHLGSDITDFADTAAIVAELDLVICIDTAIAHLAGAMNKPCWVLLPAINTDWRWLQNRSDSLWYPGVMRLFRQTAGSDWVSTINDVADNLQLWVDERSGKM